MKELSDGKTNISQLKEMVQKFVDDREWGKYHTPKDLALSISIEAAELLEIFQWSGETGAKKALDTPEKFIHLEEEMADVIVYCLSLASVTGIDVSRAIGRKMIKNEQKYPPELVRGNYRKYTEVRGAKINQGGNPSSSAE